MSTSSSQDFHPFLQSMIDGPEKSKLKALQNVVATLMDLKSVFHTNAKQLVELVKVTDFLVEKAENASGESAEAIKTLASRLAEIQKTAQAVEASLGGMTKVIQSNAGELKNVERLLTGFPALLKELKKMLGALDSRLEKPLEIKLDFPQPEAVPQELLSSWNTLRVVVLTRNFQGNIEELKITKET